MAPRFVATARRVKNCPLGLKQGDRMLFELPGVVKDESDGVCALAIPDLIPVIQRLIKAGDNQAKADEIGRTNACTACKAQNAYVEFQVQRAKGEVGSDTATGLADPKVFELVEAMKSFALFSSIPTRSLLPFIPFVKKRQYAERDLVLRRGDRGERLFLLVEGEVEVVTTDSNDVEQVVAALAKGEVFGEMSLLTGEPVAATIRCKAPSKFLTIEKSDFARLLDANPTLSLYFMKLLTDRLKKTSKRFITEMEKGVLGYLNMIAPPELIQAVQATSRSGLLRAKDTDKQIEVYLHDGHIWRITSGGSLVADPEEAFYDFLRWSQGTFRYEPGERDEPRVFFKETTALLLEGMRRSDEARGAPPGGS